jgi:hypothetical protein
MSAVELSAGAVKFTSSQLDQRVLLPIVQKVYFNVNHPCYLSHLMKIGQRSLSREDASCKEITNVHLRITEPLAQAG